MHWKHFLDYPEYFYRSLEMHSIKRRDKIWICSVIFSKVQGLQYYFPENFRCKSLEVLRKRAFFWFLSSSPSSRKFEGIFASPNRYFTENNRWVPPVELFISIIIIREKQQKPLAYIFLACVAGVWKGKGVLVVSRPNPLPLPFRTPATQANIFRVRFKGF